MKNKRIISFLAVAATGLAVVGVSVASAVPGHASLVIRHQVRGCHSWSVNGGAYKASQTVAIKKGGWITVTNNDVMSHKLVKTSGPAIRIVNLKTTMGMGMHGTSVPGAMNHMGAMTKAWFSQAGVYRFTTKAGEDYMPGMKTIGEDHILRLTVKVS
jgi:hypothetical protein